MRKLKRSIFVRGVEIGGSARISVQSMTNTATANVEATLDQIRQLDEAGCDIVRLAVLNEADARAIGEIRARTGMPLVADIHFDHRLAILSMENGVDKLRINPGNIGGAEKVRAVVACARAHHVPIRIGVNAGSMDRELLKKYGSRTNPYALVESAFSHVRLLEEVGFCDIAISLKTSGVVDTILAYQLMDAQSPYPLHLGVTETGSGEAALVKSAIGIGTLLLDGIGDTLRVSLTDEPVAEVKAARLILRTLGLLREGIDVISCPTCGRCRSRALMMATAERVKRETERSRAYLKVAVMGCAVNGPGEATDADIGIAFGKENAVVFLHGAQAYGGALPGIVERFLGDVRAMLAE